MVFAEKNNRQNSQKTIEFQLFFMLISLLEIYRGGIEKTSKEYYYEI